jgi:hypothetical protein
MSAAVPGMRPLAPDWRPKLPVATDMLEWQIVNGSRTPGPGAYVIPTTMTQSGGRFGSAITKSNLELTIDSKRSEPGPAAYMLPDHQSHMPGGRMGTGERPKSDVDWAIYRAKQGPGPGEYVIPTTMTQSGGRFGNAITKSPMEQLIDSKKNDPAPHDYDVNSSFTYLHAEQKKGGVMAGRGPKSDVDWAILRASQKPGPGAYVIPSTMNDSGGRFGSAITKSDLELAINRVKNDPAPHDYDVNAAYSYLHSEQKRGGVMAGRSGSGPAKMPAPYEQFGNESAEHYRGAPSGSHGDACAPWKNEDAWSKVRKQPSSSTMSSVSNPDISGPSEPNVSGGSAQSQPNELIKDYDEQGRAAPSSQPSRRIVDRAALTPEKRAEVIMPWRDTDAWSKVAKRPDPAISAQKAAAVVQEITSKRQQPKVAPGVVKTESRKSKGEGEGHSTVVAPWRNSDDWRSVARDPSVPEPPLPAEEKPDNTAVEAPWRVQSWVKVGPKRKKKPAAISLAPVGDASVSTTTIATTEAASDSTGGESANAEAISSRPKLSEANEDAGSSMTGMSVQEAEENAARRREEKLAQIKRLREELSAVKRTIVVADAGEHQLQLQQQLHQKQRRRRRRPLSAASSSGSVLTQKPGRVAVGTAAAGSVGRRRSSPNLPYGSDGGVRTQLEALYAKHNPSKVQDVEHLMYKYRGREAELLEAVQRKYELSV